jgi:hypothetical protein
VYLVRARVHDDDDQLSSLGAFTTMREAEACVKTLQSQGDPDISIDYEFVMTATPTGSGTGGQRDSVERRICP